ISQIYQVEADVLRVVACHGVTVPGLAIGASVPLGPGSLLADSVVERRTVHVEDAAAVPEDEYPMTRAFQRVGGYRTFVATPLLREGVPIGTLNVGRMEVRPFSEKQIKLLETFADQAVI